MKRSYIKIKIRDEIMFKVKYLKNETQLEKRETRRNNFKQEALKFIDTCVS